MKKLKELLGFQGDTQESYKRRRANRLKSASGQMDLPAYTHQEVIPEPEEPREPSVVIVEGDAITELESDLMQALNDGQMLYLSFAGATDLIRCQETLHNLAKASRSYGLGVYRLGGHNFLLGGAKGAVTKWVLGATE